MNNFKNFILATFATFLLTGCVPSNGGEQNDTSHDTPSIDIQDEKEATLDKLIFEHSADGYSAKPKSKDISGEVVIPSYYENIPVSSVESFDNCTNITSLTVFSKRESKPKDEYVPLCTLCTNAFKGCVNLTEVVLNDTHICLEERIFEGASKLESITMPKGGYISNWCLNGVPNIKKLTLSFLAEESEMEQDAKIQYDLSQLFGDETGPFGPDSLEEVTFTNDLKVLPTGALSGCRGLKKVNLPNVDFKYGSNLFSECQSLESIELPSVFHTIPSNCFTGCSSLKSVSLNSDITVVNNGAFIGCRALEEFPLTDKCSYIGEYAFSGCSSLKNIHIPNNELLRIGDGAFNECSSLETNSYEGAYYLGNDVNPYFYLLEIASRDITSLNINDKCEYIGSESLIGASNLKSVTVPESVHFVQSFAFAGAEITEISLPKVYTLAHDAFNGCHSLQTINFSTYLLEYGSGILTDCENMKSINYPGTMQEWKWNVKKGGSFSLPSSVNKKGMIHCSDGNLDAE